MKSTDARDNFVWGVDAGVFCTKYGWERYGKVDKIDAIAPHYSIFCLFFLLKLQKLSRGIRQSWSLTFRTFSLIQYIYLTAELIAFVFVALLRKKKKTKNPKQPTASQSRQSREADSRQSTEIFS